MDHYRLELDSFNVTEDSLIVKLISTIYYRNLHLLICNYMYDKLGRDTVPFYVKKCVVSWCCFLCDVSSLPTFFQLQNPNSTFETHIWFSKTKFGFFEIFEI